MQILVNGLLLGGLYALVALGFSLVWGVTNIVNLASASYLMLGAYISWFGFHRFHLDPFLSIPIAFILLFGLGTLLQSTIINRVMRHGLVMTLIITFGLDLILRNLGLWFFTADFRSVVPAYAGSGLQMLGVTVPYIRFAVFLTAILITLLLSLFLAYTRTGMAIRATTLHMEAAELVGVSVGRIYTVTYGVAAGLAGVAGVMISMLYNFNPESGLGFVPSMFVITVLGGLGSLPGAIIGGVLLGLADAFTTAFLGPSWSKLIPFLILVVILAVRPQGLMGKRFYGGSKA